MNEQEKTPTPLSSRRAEAARNDQRILDAAREVFVADPGAPIAAVAKRAGVGIGALYRRYASKEELLRRLAAAGLQQYIAAVEDALAQDDGAPWSAFSEFMRRIVDTDTHSLTLSLAGTFSPTEELNREAARAQELNVRLFQRTKAAGAISPASRLSTSACCSSSSGPPRGRRGADPAATPPVPGVNPRRPERLLWDPAARPGP